MPSNHSIISQFFSGTLAIGIARVSTIGFGIISLMFTLRNVSTADYGAYILIFVIISFLVEFTSLGLSLAIPKYMVSSDYEHFNTALISTIFYLRIITIFTVSIIILALKPILAPLFGKSLLLGLFGYIPFLFGLESLSHLFRSILTGQFGFTKMGIIEFASNACELLAIIVLIQFLKQGLTGLLIAKLISGTFSVLWAYRASRIRLRWVFSLDTLKKMLKFGFPLQMQYILGFIFSRLDTVIVGSILGTSGVAFYEVAKKIPDSINQFYSVFLSVYFPVSAKLYGTEKRDKVVNLLNNAIRMLAFLTLFGALVAVVFGHDLIILLFSEKYLSTYLTFVLLMIGLSLNFLESTLGYSLISIGEPDKPLVINVVRAIISLAGNLLLLPVLGFVGAAFVSVVSNVVVIPLNIFFLWRRKYAPQILEYLKPFSVFGLLSLLFLLLSPSLFIYKVVIALMYFPLCLVLSVVTTNDLYLIYHEANSTIGKLFGRRLVEDESSQL